MNLIHPMKSIEQPFDADPQKSYTMAARYYTDENIYQQEKADIFWQSWVYIGHSSQLKDAGDYITANLHGQEVMVVRDQEGQLGAFFNVCPHNCISKFPNTILHIKY